MIYLKLQLVVLLILLWVTNNLNEEEKMTWIDSLGWSFSS